MQDYRGISSHSVSGLSRTGEDSIRLKLSPDGKDMWKYKPSLSEIYVYPANGGAPLKSSKEIYRVNAKVKNISINR